MTKWKLISSLVASLFSFLNLWNYDNSSNIFCYTNVMLSGSGFKPWWALLCQAGHWAGRWSLKTRGSTYQTLPGGWWWTTPATLPREKDTVKIRQRPACQKGIRIKRNILEKMNLYYQMLNRDVVWSFRHFGQLVTFNIILNKYLKKNQI